MPSARLLRRVCATVLVLLVVASLVVGAVALGAVRRTLPKTDGTVTLRGLAGPVEVVRGPQGVPDVYADSPEDLFLAQGFVTAQDRFFEMDLRRHVTAGRLAELVGEAGVASDRAVRTMGWRAVAAAELPRLSAPTRRYLQAYADGVNAYLATEPNPASVGLEYLLLGVKSPGGERGIEPWGAVDSLAWLKAMAWDLHGNGDDELARAQLFADGLPLSEIRALYPTDDRHAPILSPKDWTPPASVAATTTPKAAIAGTSSGPVGGLGVAAAPATTAAVSRADLAASGAAMSAARSALAAVHPTVGRGDGIGSNSWVVAGSRTTTGKPLLANDPHLSLSQPGIWHQVGLHCRTVDAECPYDVSGFALAGMPGVVIGHTAGVAWGFTNLDPDVSDYYLERITDGRARRGTGSEPVTTRTETIAVAGGDDVTLRVRSTRHGPIISDVDPAVARVGREGPVEGIAPVEESAVALAWTGLVPGRSADALFALDRARTGADVRAAVELFSAPGQNVVWADTTGAIGYQAPGLVPVRAAATPGTPPGWLPAPGWVPQYDWTGYLPYSAMPHVENPAEGFVVAANQAVTAAKTPFLTSDWTAGYRSQRIRDLLAADEDVSPADMRAIQSDATSGFGQRLAAALLALDVKDPFVRGGQDTLHGWSGTYATGANADSRAAAFANAVWEEVLTLALRNRLGEHVDLDGGSRWALVVDGILDQPQDPLWDDPSTPVIETRDSVLLTAMARARDTLTRTMGKDVARWDYGSVHAVTLHHPLSAGFPGALRSFFDRGPFPVHGSALTPDALGGDLSADEPQAVTHGPSMRMVVDLADLDASTWVNQSGVSGRPSAKHYADQVEAWRRNEPFPWAFGKAAVLAGKAESQRLEPDRSGN